MDPNSVKIPNILRAKVAVVGESQTGKTAMSAQLCSDGTFFPKNYLMTQTMSVQVKSVNIPDTNDCVELYLADCSGREVYLDMLQDCWKGTTLLVAMYDVCNDQSFGAVTKWVEQVTAATKSNNKREERKLVGVLLANKTDLTERRMVSPKVGSELAGQLGLMYFECSAKDYTGVEDPFYYLANEYHKMYEDLGEAVESFA